MNINFTNATQTSKLWAIKERRVGVDLRIAYLKQRQQACRLAIF
jgi:hypothetical protein